MPQSRGSGGSSSQLVPIFAAAAWGQPSDALQMEKNKGEHLRVVLTPGEARRSARRQCAGPSWLLCYALFQSVPVPLVHPSRCCAHYLKVYLTHFPSIEKSPGRQNRKMASKSSRRRTRRERGSRMRREPDVLRGMHHQLLGNTIGPAAPLDHSCSRWPIPSGPSLAHQGSGTGDPP
jgi:hypothetical protein